MTTKQIVHEKIRQLVQKFTDDPQRNTYNEQKTREYYILPLFRALGWNTESPSEFTAEEQVSKGFVDFGFYLHGIPIFYLETKRVSERIDKPDTIRQAINYAYLRGVTWAVLCDFTHLAVYNADYSEWEEADDEKLLQARFLSLHFSRYDNDDFENLWLLSKEAFTTRLLDARAEKYGKKSKREPVTTVLFRQFISWRKQLFEVYRQLGGDRAKDNVLVDNAVQRLLDRLIFIRSLEDRNVEKNELQTLLRVAQKEGRKAGIYPDLQALFRTFDENYNSSLFAKSDVDLLPLNDDLLIAEIINGLYGNRWVKYDFNAISTDILGAVYEQYLSFKAQDPSAQLTVKSHKRKSQGIYYTPQFIVRYIVQHAIGRALANGVQPLHIRILDPACGSGSFLIEAFDFLDRALDAHIPNPSERREHILKHNLYGVDLDVQAVEVTKLNLFLRVAYQRRLLPPLTHIKHGDSLVTAQFDWHGVFDDVFADGGFDVIIGNPPYVRQETLTTDFKTYAQAHYTTYSGTADLYVYFIERGLSLLKTDGQLGFIFPNKWMRAGYGKGLRALLTSTTIHSILDFGDLPIFKDATTYPCILHLQKGAPQPQFLAIDASQYDYSTDLSTYASTNQYPVQRANLKPTGWSLAKNTDQHLLDKMRGAGVTLGDYVGDKVYYGIKTGYNAAFVIDDKTRRQLIAQDPRSADVIKPFLSGRDIQRYEAPRAEKYVIFLSRSWIRAQMVGLSDEADMPVRTAFLPSSDKSADMDAQKRVRTGSRDNDENGAWHWLHATYPAVMDYLAGFKKCLMPKPQGHTGKWDGRAGGNYEWYELQSPTSYYAEFEKPKILYQVFQVKPAFMIDTDGFYMSNAIWTIGLEDYALLGILNSKWGWFQIQHTCTQIQNGYQLIWKYLRQVQIPSMTDVQRADLSRMVQKQLELHTQLAGLDEMQFDQRADIQERIAKTDNAIDDRVAGLYGI